MVVDNKPFLASNATLSNNDYKGYRNWLNGVNSSGNQPNFDAESDLRIKKFTVDTFGGDDTIRKMLMLNFVSNGIIDKNLADIYILKGLQRGY